MPEIKNTFTSGKMNKDLDERIVPKNEYRDALNIDIATTEGSDIGSAQNSFGNLKVSNIGITGAKCIGSILNPENQKIIWFVAGTDIDAILEYDQPADVIEPVLVDNTVATTSQTNGVVSNSTSITIDANTDIEVGMILEGDGIEEVVKVASVVSSTSITTNIPVTIADDVALKLKRPFLNFNKENLITGINVIDNLLFWTDGVSEPKKINIDRFKLGVASSDIFTTTTKLVDANNVKTTRNVLEENITVIKQYPLDAPTLTLFRDAGGTTDPSLTQLSHPQKTSYRADGNPFAAGSTGSTDIYHQTIFRVVDGGGSSITGVTVNFNNGDDSLNNTAVWNGVEVGMTVVDANGVVLKDSSGNVIGVDAIASANPGNGAQVTLKAAVDGGIADNATIGFRWALSHLQTRSFWTYVDENDVTQVKPQGTSSTYDLLDSSGSIVKAGGKDFIEADSNNILPIRIQKVVFKPRPNYKQGDIVILKAPNTSTTTDTDDDVTVRLKLLAEDVSGAVKSNQYRKVFDVKIVSISEDIKNMPIADADLWSVSKETETEIFKDKFPRFAYRWKYIDGEYSCISAFSEIAFLPTEGGYNFNAEAGSNINMTNTVSKIELSQFALTPKDVVELDILVKMSDSPSIYKFKTLNYSDISTLDTIDVVSEQLNAMLPANQLLRPYDNVPKKAKAQEITANRLLYANYTQQYNVIDKPNFIFELNSSSLDSSTATKSIKSLRTYQLGVSLLDKYGRQTPVFSRDDNATITLNQVDSFTGNSLSVKSDFAIDDNFTHLKYYIKEPKGEFYNLTMDRVYEAETEEFVWISFPSSDVNKVQEGDEIVLKKAHDQSGKFEVARTVSYNVISKALQAPDAIKTKRVLLGRLENQLFGTNSDNTTGYPVVDGVVVRLRGNGGIADNDVLKNAASVSSASRFIRVGSYQKNTVSKFYEIDSITRVDFNDDGDFLDNDDYYEVLLKYPFDVDISFMGTPPGDSGRAEYFELYEDQVDDFREEFEGRFFIKTLKDDFLVNFVTSIGGSDGLVYGIQTTERVYWIQTINNSSAGSSTNNSGVVAANEAGYQAPTGNGEDDVSVNNNPDFSNKFGNELASETIEGGDYEFRGNITAKVNEPGGTSSSNLLTFDAADSKNVLVGADITGYSALNSIRVTHINATGSSINVVLDLNNPTVTTALAAHTAILNGTASVPDNTVLTFKRDATILSDPALYAKGGIEGNGDVDGVMKGYWSYRGAIALNQQIHGHDMGRQRYAIDQAWAWNQGSYGRTPPRSFLRSQSNGHGFKLGSKEVDFRLFNIGPGHIKDSSHPDGYSFNPPNGPQKNQIEKNYTLYRALKKVGTKFRWTDDPEGTIYTVLKAEFVDVNNYSNTEITNSRDYHRSNCGIRFALTLDKAITWSPTSRFLRDGTTSNLANRIIPFDGSVETDPENDPNTATSHSGRSVNTSELQILTPVNDRRTFSSSNPAVFEVQPKETSDLNLYYETPNSFLILRDDMFIQTSVVKPDGTIDTGVFDSGTQITLVGDDYNDPGILIKGVDPYAEQNKHVEAGSIITIFTKDNNGNTQFKQRLKTKQTVYAPNVPIYDEDGNVTNTGSTIRQYFYYDVPLNWFNCFAYGNGVETNRIKDAFNEVTIDKGPRVSTTFLDNYQEETLGGGIIYSGIFNSKSGVNNLNQFIQAEKITKDLNPSYGTIQKLFTRNTNVISFCEHKTLKILANKDALFNADGNVNLTSTNNVLGQAVPFAGEFGISKNPESFASYGYRVYFTDKNRNAVLRLSNDGLTDISKYGMSTFFKDNLSVADEIIGSYDEDKDVYNVTLNGKTVSFAENINGWTSLKSFIPENGFSVSGDYYTVFEGELYQHNASTLRNNFYNVQYDSTIKFIFNDLPSDIKIFKSLNYEGTTSRIYTSDNDDISLTTNGWFSNKISTGEQQGQVVEFKEKEGKWFNYIQGTANTVSNLDPKELSVQGLGVCSAVSVSSGTHTTKYSQNIRIFSPETSPTLALVGSIYAGSSGVGDYPTSESGNPAAVGETHANTGFTLNSATQITGVAKSTPFVTFLKDIVDGLIIGETYTLSATVNVTANPLNKALGFSQISGVSDTARRVNTGTGVISETFVATGTKINILKGKNVAGTISDISIATTNVSEVRYPKYIINTSESNGSLTTKEITVNRAVGSISSENQFFYVHAQVLNGQKWSVKASDITITESSDPNSLMGTVVKEDGFINGSTWTASSDYVGLHKNVVRLKVPISGTMPAYNLVSLLKAVVVTNLTQN